MCAIRINIEKLDENIGCQVLLILAFLSILPSSTGYIDCRISCRRCHENTEHPSVLEVYCAMCEECKQRRRERMQGRTTRTKNQGVSPPGKISEGTEDSSENVAKPMKSPAQSEKSDRQRKKLLQDRQADAPPRARQREPYESALLEWPGHCPTPPYCSESEEEPERLTNTASTVTTQATTTTTTTAPTPPPCPPIPPCRKKRKPMTMMPMMMPCMPCMSMCPCPVYTYPSVPNLPLAAPSTTVHTDFHYVYVGIPKKS